MPTRANWREVPFENDRASRWFALMADPGHIRAGLLWFERQNAPSAADISIIHSG